MAITPAITLSRTPSSAPTLQAVYAAGDANKITMVTCSAGVESVLVSNRSGGATLLVQTCNVVQDASVASSAFQLIQTGSLRILAADCNASPSGAWSFGLASAGSATADLMARVL